MPDATDRAAEDSQPGRRRQTRRLAAVVGGRVSGSAAAVRRILETLRERLAALLAPVVGPPLRVLRRFGRVIGRIADVLWRIPLVIAALAMGVAAVVQARGNQDLAWSLITGGFAIGLLGVPLGLISVGFGRALESEPRADPERDPADSTTSGAIAVPNGDPILPGSCARPDSVLNFARHHQVMSIIAAPPASQTASQSMSTMMEWHEELSFPPRVSQRRTAATVDKPAWMFFCGEWVLDNGQW